MIICHNHPSGNLNPSQADKNFTNSLVRDAKEFEISVLDHIIITENSYYSFADNGIL
jgi:DNA repair protein RadC